MKIDFLLKWIVVTTIFLSSCGNEFHGTYDGVVNGKTVSLQLLEDETAAITGFFPEELKGSWQEEKFLDREEIWVTFDGPEKKPFRLRFELQTTTDGLKVKTVKSRPMGKGAKLVPLEIEDSPILRPRT